MSIGHNLQPSIMAVHACGDVLWRHRSMSMDQNLQPIITAVQAVPPKRFHGSKIHKFVLKRFSSIQYDLPKEFGCVLERHGPRLPPTAWNEEENHFCNCLRPSGSVTQESCNDSPKQSFHSFENLRIDSECGNGSNKGKLQSHLVVRHVQGPTSVKETYRPPKHNHRGKTSVPTARARDLKRHVLQVGREGDNLHMPSASTTSVTIAMLKNRLQQGIITDSYEFVTLLKRCSSQKDLVAARQLHECISQSGMDQNPYVANTLLSVYISCGRLQDARRLFDGLQKKTVVTWNTMIGGYAKSNQAENALEVFNRMRYAGVMPGERTCLNILKACSSDLALKWGKEIHEYVRHAGLESDVCVGTALIQMYAKCGSITEARRVFDNLTNRDVITWTVMIDAYAASGRIDEARLVFDRMEERDVMTWNIMIGAYAEMGCGVEAYRLFVQMKHEGFKPNAFTYTSILNAPASAGASMWLKEVHSHALKAGLDSEVSVGNSLVHMYAKSGSIDDARLVFDRMKKRNVVTWTAMIGGLAQHGCGNEALELLRRMNADCVKPDGTAFVALLSACCHAGLLDDGRKLFLAMTRDYGIEPIVVHYTCMVDLLGRAGQLKEAKLFIGDMPVEPNGVTWTALLGACRTHGNVDLGEFAAGELLKLEPKNSSAYVVLSNIYAAAGMWEKVSSVRSMMQERGVYKDAGRSWIEVDNQIHEFIAGDTSHPEAKAIHTELNKLTEELKAEGYVPDTQFVLKNIDEEDKELALCSHSEKLAIVYGLIRAPRGKPIRVFKNLRVCSDCHTATKFISKVTGREIIARDANRFHHFKDGMCSCGDYW